MFAKLKKKLEEWDNPVSRTQFVERATELYLKQFKMVDANSRLNWQKTHMQIDAEVFSLLRDTESHVVELERYFTEVLQDLPKDRGGRRKDLALQFIILWLKPIWEEGTAKKAGRSQNPRTKEIGGPFVRFVTECLTYLDPENHYPAIGETISKVLQPNFSRHLQNSIFLRGRESKLNSVGKALRVYLRQV